MSPASSSASPPALLLVETSPLISLVRVARVDLLDVFGVPLACTDFVRAEVRREELRQTLDALIAGGRTRKISLTDPAHLVEMEALYARGLGRGECSSIVLAAAHGYGLVIDDKRARKAAARKGIMMFSTAETVVMNIQRGVLSLAEADELIVQWKALGEFPVTASSFADLL